MVIYKKQIKIYFYIFLTIHLILWTLIPSLTNNNLPLDTIEALAWGNNLDWGFNKHPPMSAFMVEIFYSIFGSNDWAYYLLSQIFIIFSFFVIFQFSKEILNNEILAVISVLLLEGIYFYNFTTPEFNVNVCQIPFWVLTVYYSWKVFNQKIPKLIDCVIVGVFLVYIFKSQINLKKVKSFLLGFLFLFFLSPIIYSYISLTQKDKRTDYPGKEIALKTQIIWDQDFKSEIEFVTGDEWKAGNLSYHLKSRPTWEGSGNDNILKNSSQFICINDVCLGRY